MNRTSVRRADQAPNDSVLTNRPASPSGGEGGLNADVSFQWLAVVAD